MCWVLLPKTFYLLYPSFLNRDIIQLKARQLRLNFISKVLNQTINNFKLFKMIGKTKIYFKLKTKCSTT